MNSNKNEIARITQLYRRYRIMGDTLQCYNILKHFLSGYWGVHGMSLLYWNVGWRLIQLSVCLWASIRVCVLVCVCLWRLNCPSFPSCGLCSIWGNLAYASLSISGGCRSFQMCCSSVKVEVVGCSRCLFKRSCCSLCCPPFDTLARCCLLWVERCWWSWCWLN